MPERDGTQGSRGVTAVRRRHRRHHVLFAVVAWFALALMGIGSALVTHAAVPGSSAPDGHTVGTSTLAEEAVLAQGQAEARAQTRACVPSFNLLERSAELMAGADAEAVADRVHGLGAWVARGSVFLQTDGLGTCR